MINLYDKNETDFNNNGLVVLSDCKSCYITEELNGRYYLELEYPKDARGKYQYLQGLNIIKADGQLFRIPMLSKAMDTGATIKAIANHIFYDLYYDFIESLNINDVTTDAVMRSIVTNRKFNVLACDNIQNISLAVERVNPVQVIFELIKKGGELYRDNFNIAIKSSIGQNNGVLISYGKNITGLEQTLDYSNLATRVMPTGKDGMTIDLVNGGSKYLESPRINDYPFSITKEVQFPDFDDAGQLKAEALKLWGQIDIPLVNYKVNFIDLSKTKEYKNYKQLLTVKCGDTVIVRHKVFGIDITAKVIKTKKNVLTGRLEEVELGQFKNTIADTLNNMSNSIVQINTDISKTRSMVQQTNDRIALIVTQDGKILPASIEASINGNETSIVLKADKILFDTDGTGEGKGIVSIANGILTADAIKALNLEVGKEIQMGPDAVIQWSNLSPESQQNLTGPQGPQGPQGPPGPAGSDANVPSWVSSTVIGPGYVVAPWLQGNAIYTSAAKDNWLILEGGNIKFMHKNTNGQIVEVFRFSIDSATEGKPQLFLANGCSIDTYEGSLRLRTSDTNYLRINADGGVDYVNGSTETSLTGEIGQVIAVFG